MPTHHTIDYIEFTVTDMAAAQAFYAAAFEWEFNAYGDEYAGIRSGDGEAGGFRVGTPKAGAGPLVILYSENLEASLRAIVDGGSTITTGPFEFPGGRRFYFRDPSGNELAVWAPRKRLVLKSAICGDLR
ncbi:MAG: VOC family protein [Planctomycetes bacterium]|nr:VOC family protein [Planctomycetota bacterium]